MSEYYPIAPVLVPDTITKPSPEFKREVFKVSLSILLFIIAYFILIVSASILAIGAGYGGLLIMSFKIHFFTLMIGLGLIGLGLMVLFFLIKFIFKKSHIDRSHLIEIKREDQPAFFDFIRKLTKEVKAPFPKRIYISSDVNASVFYDSGFWSMFFPVRKNLQIGLGLVNAMNLSEFKAVLAHEFGHFSQRSMKLGSYVYNVNRVIYNLLYDNSDYQQTLDKWANMNNYFAFFSMITSGIVMVIQAMLKGLYNVINKSYYSLSRQMEFHADTVAASVAGGNHLISALRRLEFAEACQQELLNFCGGMVRDNHRVNNLFPHHSMIMKQIAGDLKISIRNEFPMIDKETVKRLASSRIFIKDQWASHPTTDEREDHLTRLGLVTEVMHQPAWAAFNNPEKLQQQITDLIYVAVTFKETPVSLSKDEFEERYQKSVQKNDFHPIYKGFYDARDVQSVAEIPVLQHNQTLDQILTTDLLQMPRRINVIKNDIGILEAIQQPKSEVKTFDFEGKRHKLKDAAAITEALKLELVEIENQVIEAESNMIALAFCKAGEQAAADKLFEEYEAVRITKENFTKCAEHFYDIMGILQPAYQGQVSIGQAVGIDNQLKLNEEKVKTNMIALLDNPRLLEWCNADDAEIMRKYASSKLNYFREESGFNNDSLTLFNDAQNIFYNAVGARMLQAKKNLLDWQAQFLESPNGSL